jgi:hypothetical protein
MSSAPEIETEKKPKIRRKLKCKYPKCKTYFNPINELNICCENHHKLIYTYEKPEECPICLTSFNSNEEKKKKNIHIPLIPCHHWVCTNCVINSGKSECPICRQTVNLNEREEQKCNRKALRIKKDKERVQLEEDRRMAEQMQREINNQNVERNVIRVVVPMREIPRVSLNNAEEMLQIINGLVDPIERQLFRHMILGQLHIRNDEDDYEDEIEGEIDDE